MDETSGFVEVIESGGFFVWGVGGDQDKRIGADIACAISTTALRPRGRNSIDNDRDCTFCAAKIVEHLKLCGWRFWKRPPAPHSIGWGTAIPNRLERAGAGVEHHHIQEPPLSSPAQLGRTGRAAV